MKITNQIKLDKKIKQTNMLMIAATMLLLVGCSKSNSTNQTKNTNSTDVSSTKLMNKNKKPKKEVALWSENKRNQLADFMRDFSQKMNQIYHSYSPENNVSFFGINFPDFFSEDKIKVDDEHVSVAWSNNGEKTADYSVVAVYSDVDPETFIMGAHLYLFALKNNEPVVLITQQNQGMPDQMIHFSETKNESLSSNFSKIIKGAR